MCMTWQDIIGWKNILAGWSGCIGDADDDAIKKFRALLLLMSHRVSILSSHLSPDSAVMASEKEAALAATPDDSPTM